MDEKDTVKAVVGAACALALVILMAYLWLYVILPCMVLYGVYLAYTYYRDHPGTQARRLQRRARELYAQLPELRADFSAFGEFAAIAKQLCVPSLPALPPPNIGAIELGRYVDRLSAAVAQPNSLDLAMRAVRETLSNYADLVPDLPAGNFSTTLLDFIPDTGKAIEHLVYPFYDEEVRQAGALTEVRAQLDRNLHRMSSVPFDPQNYDSPKLVLPSKHKGTPHQLVNGYLANTPLCDLFDRPLRLGIPEKLRFEGTWIIAPPGRGKTTLLSQLLEEDLEKDCALILMDSKGEFIDHVKRLECFAGSDRLVLIEPSPDLALNPLDIGATSGHKIALLEYVFTSLLDTEPTALQSTLFRSVLMAMEVIPNATFDTFRRFLQDGWQPFERYIRLMHPDDQDFFLKIDPATRKSLYDSKTYNDTKTQLLWRIRKLTTEVPLLRDMFKSPTTKIDLGALMDAGKVIIIDNSAARLSDGGSEFFSRFFLALILGAAQQRAGRDDADKLPCYVYIDECDTVISNDKSVPSILHRCRSQKIGLVLAHQEIQQIKSADVQSALANCAVRLANSDDEASQLAPRLRTTPDALRSLKKGQFALFMRDYTPKAAVVEIRNNPVKEWPKMSDADYRAIEERMHERYCYSGWKQGDPAPQPYARTPHGDPIYDVPSYEHADPPNAAPVDDDTAQPWQ